MKRKQWRFFVHEDGRHASINDGLSGDTLLRLTGGDLDVAKAREFERHLAAATDQARREGAEEEREQIRGRLMQWPNARESSALVQSETASRDGTLRWITQGRAEAYEDTRTTLDDLLAALTPRPLGTGGRVVIPPKKRCAGCKAIKPLDQFFRNKKAKDGRQSRCKPCASAQTEEWRRANRERHNEHNRKSRARNPKRKREELERERQLYPEKNAARRAVEEALLRGKLIRPSTCEDCGKECKPHAHHRDYSRPLDVRWLCPRCHKAEHKREAAPAHTEEKGEGR